MSDKAKSSGLLGFFSPSSTPAAEKRKTRPSPGTDSSPEDIEAKRGRQVDLDDVRETLDIESDHLNDLMQAFEAKFEKNLEIFKRETTKEVKFVLKGLTDRIDKLEKRVDKCEKDILSKTKEITACTCTEDIKNIKKELNRQAQYSRKDSVRIFGLPETPQEDCKVSVCEMLKSKLNVKISPRDLAAAHRLPAKDTSKPKPVIVRLRDRAHKEEILRERKRLRGKGISIGEDMTIDNVKLVNRAQNSEIFESVWFWNGKVHAKDKRGRHTILDLYQDFGNL